MKKFITFILVGTLALLMLVGCGSNTENNNPDNQTITDNVNPSDTPTPSPTDEPTTTPTPSPTETPTPTPEPHTHSYSESITKAATCVDAGEKTFTCECGDTYTEQIEATGHNYEAVADSEVSATCTNDGKEADTKCSLCDDVITGAVIPATGHNYESVTGSEVAPTCEADGKKADEVCTLCGDTINGEAISATGHNYGNYVYNNDATVEKDGTETAKCSTCDKTKTRTKEGTKLEPETHWYDGYARGVWHDMGEYMFWIGNTIDDASDMAMCNDALAQADVLKSRYPDRKTYAGAGMQGGIPTAFVSTSKGTPGKEGFWRPTFIWE